MRGARYLLGSTRKVMQLTGDYDRERGQTVANQTGWRYGLAGTDLGYSFEHEGRLYFLFGDSNASQGYNQWRPESGDAVASTTSTDPSGISLEFWTAPDGFYRSPRVVPQIKQGSLEVPVAGFSADGKMYVYFTTDHSIAPDGSDVMGRTVLTKLSNQSEAEFRQHYELSNVAQGGRFINVACAKVDNARIPGLPDGQGAGLLLWGSGLYRKSNPYLAYMPLGSVEKRETLWYFDGTAANPHWSRHEAEAAALFEQPQIGEFCVVWLEDVQGWLMLYNAGNPRGINYRFAAQPWGEWSPARVLFDPWCDGGYGHFMHASYLDHGRIDAVQDDGRENEWGGEYGPYVIERFTKREGTQLTVYFVMSTWNPYNTELMKTTFLLDAWRGWYALPGAEFNERVSLAAVTRHPDRMEIWATGKDGIVRGNWFDAGWHGWYALGGARFAQNTPLAAVTRNADRMEIWALGEDGVVRGNWFDGGWHGWYTLPGAAFNQGVNLAAVSRHPDRMEIWAVGQDGIVRGNWFDGGWHGWYALEGARFQQDTPLAVVSRHPDRMELWALDEDGVVRGNWFDGGWHGWYALPGVVFNQGVNLTVVSRDPDRMEIWAVDPNGVVRGNWFDGGWHGWYALDGARFGQDAPIAAVSRHPERMEIWGVGEDGVVRGNFFDHGWHKWYELGGAAFHQGGKLAALTRHAERMEIWCIGMDGVVRGNWFDAA